MATEQLKTYCIVSSEFLSQLSCLIMALAVSITHTLSSCLLFQQSIFLISVEDTFLDYFLSSWSEVTYEANFNSRKIFCSRRGRNYISTIPIPLGNLHGLMVVLMIHKVSLRYIASPHFVGRAFVVSIDANNVTLSIDRPIPADHTVSIDAINVAFSIITDHAVCVIVAGHAVSIVAGHAVCVKDVLHFLWRTKHWRW